MEKIPENSAIVPSIPGPHGAIEDSAANDSAQRSAPNKSYQYGVRKIPGKWLCYFPSLTRYVKREYMVCNERENTRENTSCLQKDVSFLVLSCYF